MLWRKGDAMAEGFSVLVHPEHVIGSFQSLLLTTLVPRGVPWKHEGRLVVLRIDMLSQ